MISVMVSPSRPKIKALQEAGSPVPKFVTAKFLIDTGAQVSYICSSIATRLELEPTGITNVLTPSTGSNPVQQLRYDVSLLFIGPKGVLQSIETIPVTATDFVAQGIEGLIGRDILARCTLVYIGEYNMFTLNF